MKMKCWMLNQWSKKRHDIIQYWMISSIFMFLLYFISEKKHMQMNYVAITIICTVHIICYIYTIFLTHHSVFGSVWMLTIDLYVAPQKSRSALCCWSLWSFGDVVSTVTSFCPPYSACLIIQIPNQGITALSTSAEKVMVKTLPNKWIIVHSILWAAEISPSNSKATFVQSTRIFKMFKNPLKPVILVFIG